MTNPNQSEHAGRLIVRIETEAKAECDRILLAARDEAAGIVASARANARTRLRAAIAELRRNGAREVAKMHSRVNTEKRQLRQRQGAEAQDRGLSRLCAALDSLWQNKEARSAWCAQVLSEAQAHLLPGEWRIEYPKGWPADETTAFAAAITAHCSQPPAATESETIRSGLIVIADTARLDATGPGLCRDTMRLQALFQSALDAMAPEEQT